MEQVFGLYPNTAVDLTPGSEMYGDFFSRAAYYKEFFTRNCDRIQFGTDASDEADEVDSNLWLADTVYNFLTTEEDFRLWEVTSRGLGLADNTAKKILSENFLRRVGETPKPVNTEALKAYVRKYRHLIRDVRVRENVDKAISLL